jgi:hypothetical protein
MIALLILPTRSACTVQALKASVSQNLGAGVLSVSHGLLDLPLDL